MRKSIRKGLRIYLQKKLVSLLFKIKRNRILFLEIDILKMKNAYDIMPLGKRRNVFIVTQQKPRRRKLRGFFSVLARWISPQADYQLLIFYPAICKCSRRLHLPE